MARHDLEHDDERAHSGDWRDDDSRQHRWTGRGREFADPHEQHFNRPEEGYAASRERGRDYREHEREPMGGPLPRGYRDSGYEPERGRRFTDTDDRRRSQAWDWDAEHSRTVDWSPRHHWSRDSWSPREMRGHEDWERTSGDRALSHYKQSVSSSSSGPYVGRGPRGYRRPDSRIHEDVCELLTRHGQIDASDVDVSVDQGVVTLRGSVDGRHTKRLVEDVIDDVTGVKDVRNELSVDQTERGTPSRTYTADASSYQARVRDDERRRYTDGGEQQPSATSSFEGESVSQSSEGRFISPSGSQYRDQIREGMEVVGSDGASIGDVRDISNNSFLVHRSTNRDVSVPFAAVRSLSGNWVMLNIRADEVDDQGWATPDLTGAPMGESGTR